jgi:CO/xanthine dehydrogenase Mo-binding subunit
VKWTQTRNEAHISDDDARDNIVDAALALERDGKFLAVKIRSFGNLGAFVSFRGAMPPVVNIGTVVGTYTTPAVHVKVSGMLTNTHCTSPYRGAGRPEASYMIERKIDPAELRRRNTLVRLAYIDKPPLLLPSHARDAGNAAIRVLSQKQHNWAYEREWRVLGSVGRVHYRRKHAIRDIFFGSRIDPHCKAQVLSAIRGMSIKAYLMEIDGYEHFWEEIDAPPKAKRTKTR